MRIPNQLKKIRIKLGTPIKKNRNRWRCSVRIGSKKNEYMNAVGERAIDEAPKAVWVALAYSLALISNEGSHEGAIKTLREEWKILHENGIIPQKPKGVWTK